MSARQLGPFIQKKMRSRPLAAARVSSRQHTGRVVCYRGWASEQLSSEQLNTEQQRTEQLSGEQRHHTNHWNQCQGDFLSAAHRPVNLKVWHLICENMSVFWALAEEDKSSEAVLGQLFKILIFANVVKLWLRSATKSAELLRTKVSKLSGTWKISFQDRVSFQYMTISHVEIEETKALLCRKSREAKCWGLIFTKKTSNIVKPKCWGERKNLQYCERSMMGAFSGKGYRDVNWKLIILQKTKL